MKVLFDNKSSSKSLLERDKRNDLGVVCYAGGNNITLGM